MAPRGDIDAIDWASSEHAYGSAEDVPAMLRGLADPSTAAECADAVAGSLFHQGTVYPATALAVPFLIEVAGRPDVDAPVRATLLHLLSIAGAYGCDDPDNADNAEPGYLSDCIDAACAGRATYIHALSDPDPLVRECAAVALAHCHDERLDAQTALFDRLGEEPAGRARATMVLASAHLFDVDGGDSEPLLVEGLADPDPALRYACAIDLARRRGALDDELVRVIADLLDVDPGLGDGWVWPTPDEDGLADELGPAATPLVLRRSASPGRPGTSALRTAEGLVRDYVSPAAALATIAMRRLHDPDPEVELAAADLAAAVAAAHPERGDILAGLTERAHSASRWLPRSAAVDGQESPHRDPASQAAAGLIRLDAPTARDAVLLLLLSQPVAPELGAAAGQSALTVDAGLGEALEGQLRRLAGAPAADSGYEAVGWLSALARSRPLPGLAPTVLALLPSFPAPAAEVAHRWRLTEAIGPLAGLAAGEPGRPAARAALALARLSGDAAALVRMFRTLRAPDPAVIDAWADSGDASALDQARALLDGDRPRTHPERTALVRCARRLWQEGEPIAALAPRLRRLAAAGLDPAVAAAGLMADAGAHELDGLFLDLLRQPTYLTDRVGRLGRELLRAGLRDEAVVAAVRQAVIDGADPLGALHELLAAGVDPAPLVEWAAGDDRVIARGAVSVVARIRIDRAVRAALRTVA